MKKILAVILGLFVLAPSLVVASPNTLYEYFNGRVPNFSGRVKMASFCNINNYRATKSDNIRLLECLKNEDTFIGGYLPAEKTPEGEEMLGSGYNPITGYQSRTTQYISAAATTIPVASTKDKAGNQISLANISASGTVAIYMNLEPGTVREEPIVCTGVTVSSWTGCTRGIAFQGSSESSSSTIAVAHNAGAAIIITNIGQFYNQYVAVDGTQNINGIKTFTTYPEFRSSTVIPTTSAQFATKYYVDQVGAGGFTSANVSTTRGLSVDGSVPERVGINASSTTGIKFSTGDGSLYQAVSSTKNLAYDTNGIYINGDDAQTWTGLNTFTATTTFTTTTMASTTATSVNVTTINNKPVSDIFGVSTTPALEYHYHPSIQTSGAASRAVNLTGFQQIFHNLGVIPSYITFNGYSETDNAGAVNYAYSNGSYTSTTLATAQSEAHFVLQSDGTNNSFAGTGTGNVLVFKDLGTSDDAVATVVTPTSTSFFYLNWTTNVNAGDTRVFTWTAFK